MRPDTWGPREVRGPTALGFEGRTYVPGTSKHHAYVWAFDLTTTRKWSSEARRLPHSPLGPPRLMSHHRLTYMTPD